MITIKKSSWHYRLILEMNKDNLYCGKPLTSCRYVTLFITSSLWAVLQTAMVCVVALVAVIVTSEGLAHMAACISLGTFVSFNESGGALVFYGLILILGVAWIVRESPWERVLEKRRLAKANQEPGIIRMMLLRFRDKVCVRVQVED